VVNHASQFAAACQNGVEFPQARVDGQKAIEILTGAANPILDRCSIRRG